MEDATTVPGESSTARAEPMMPGARDVRNRAVRVPAQPGTGRVAGRPALTAHRLPRARVVDRDEFLMGAAAGRAVTHVGFMDAGRRDAVRRDDRWLHARLATVARDLVGVDVDVDGVAAARATGYKAHVVDVGDPVGVARAAIRPAELVVVGEVIECVTGMGAFLDGLRALCTPEGTLIVTVPNAFRLMNIVGMLTGRELAHPGQVARYSWYTLVNVLERHSWRVMSFHPYEDSEGEPPGRARVVLAAERAARLVVPLFAGGLIAVCRRVPSLG